MNPPLPKGAPAEIIAFAQQLESMYGVRILAIYNPYRITIGGLPTISVFVCPINSHHRMNPAFEGLVHRIWEEVQQKNVCSVRKGWAFAIVRGFTDWSLWFAQLRREDGTWKLLASFGQNADLCGEALYGHDLFNDLHRQAEAFFKIPRIAEFWKQEALRLKQLQNERVTVIEREHIAYLRERTRLLNRYEREELRDMVREVTTRYLSRAYDIIVAFDGSARPIGKAIEWYSQGRVPITYMAPKPFRVLKKRDGSVPADMVEIFEREFSHVAVCLRAHPERVLFIDDQTGYGNTAAGLQVFVDHVSGGRPSNLLVMSQFDGTNCPRWHKRRDLQGLEIREDALTFRAVERPTRKSEIFYRVIRSLVETWRRTDTAP